MNNDDTKYIPNTKIFINSSSFKCFILASVLVDLKPTLGIMWEYTLNGTPLWDVMHTRFPMVIHP